MRRDRFKNCVAKLMVSPVVLGFAAPLLIGSAAHAALIPLFQTQNDFSSWQNNGAITVGTQATPDSDGSSINGLGNTTNAGGAGTPGSLLVTEGQGSGTYNFNYSGGEQGNAAFLAALGSSGTISLDYTAPTNPGGAGNYYQFGLVLNYSGNFGQFFGGAAVNDGNGFFTQTIPYTVNTASSYSYFQLGIIYSSNFETGGPSTFTLDNIGVVAVPEPASLGMLSLSGVALLRRRRR